MNQEQIDPAIAQALAQTAPLDPIQNAAPQSQFIVNDTITTSDASAVGNYAHQQMQQPAPIQQFFSPSPDPMQIQQVAPPPAPAQTMPMQQPVSQMPQPPAPAMPMAPPAPAPQQAAPPMMPVPQPMPQPTVASTPTKESDKPLNPNSSQNTLMFDELRDNMIIMGDGTYRAVLACQSINFDLMSERERSGIEYSYQNFLNSLTFDIQIYIRSQRVDIGPYLNKLEQVRINQDNMLLGVLMDDYIQFVDMLSQEANIMDKSFFVIIPYMYGEERGKIGKGSDTTKGLLTNLLTPSNYHKKMKIPVDIYKRAREVMNQRASSTIDSLAALGINAVRLKTKELGSLLYNIYNPDTASRQPIGDFRNYTNIAVRGGGNNSNPNNMNGGF